MKKYIVFVLISLFVSLSCEYEPQGTHYVELTPPANSIPVTITLNDVTPLDTIVLRENTIINIKIDAPKALIFAIVLLDTAEIYSSDDKSFSFLLEPENLPEGLHKLSVNAFFIAGSGSLAEMMGLEGYFGELAWNILVIHDLQKDFEVGHRLNKDGFLEIFWENDILYDTIEKYVVRINYSDSFIINDPKQKSFVDYSYVCGHKDIFVGTYIKGGYYFSKKITIDNPLSDLSLEEIDYENIRLFWNKPYAKANYKLFEDDSLIFLSNTDTSIIIPQIFGVSRHFYLRTSAYNDTLSSHKFSFESIEEHFLGISMALYTWAFFAYNINDNILYATNYNYLFAYDAESMLELSGIYLEGNPFGLAYGGKIASAPHNSKMLAMTGEETYIFADNTFNNPLIIPSLKGDISTHLASITSDDRFFVVQKNEPMCHVFNILSGEKIFDFPFSYNTVQDVPDFVSVSENGKYFCASSYEGIEIMEIMGTKAELIYTDTRDYGGAMFVPNQPDMLLLKVDNSIEIRQIPGFNLVQSIDVGNHFVVIGNIDPKSNSLTYVIDDLIKVCKIDDLSNTIFSVKSSNFNVKLYNYKLISHHGGIYIDIRSYFNK